VKDKKLSIMAIVPLKMKTILKYLGNTTFNPCREISKIHVEHDDNRPDEALVKALISPITTSRGDYIITVRILSNGKSILDSYCTCPIGNKCKHIYEVLCRISVSDQQPLYGPSEAYLARVAAARKRKEKSKHAKVWIAKTCRSERDRGDHWGRFGGIVKDEYDPQILGVFFSRLEADNCAEEYVQSELGHEIEKYESEDEDESEDDDDDDDDDDDASCSFDWNGDERGIFEDEDKPGGPVYTQVWVEQHAIEDATNRFRK
jgi:hypothetical protein